MSSPTDEQKESKNNITSEYVKLNVGGMLFYTTISTLTKFKESMLAAMFSGRMEQTIDKDGFVLIDRSGKHFGVILNFLRDGTVPLPNLNKEIAELRAEANFFCISELVKLCDEALVVPKNINDIGTNPFLTLQKPLEENVIKSLTKPAIILKLGTNREYAYNHLEMFEKLAFEFHEDILFIRYVWDYEYSMYQYFFKGKLVGETASHDVPQLQIYEELVKLYQSLKCKNCH